MTDKESLSVVSSMDLPNQNVVCEIATSNIVLCLLRIGLRGARTNKAHRHPQDKDVEGKGATHISGLIVPAPFGKTSASQPSLMLPDLPPASQSPLLPGNEPSSSIGTVREPMAEGR